ncbi:hypothetical protein ACJJTC_017806 [Scirpophaga incertulas]
MKLSTPRYTICLFFQLLLMLCDLLFNCMSLFPRTRHGLLVIFLFQDILLVLATTTMLLTFFSTYLFQAGLVEVLVSKFRAAAGVCIAYITACIVLHTVWLHEKWTESDSISTPMLIFLFTVQRCLSPCYYFFYKRAAIRISDPRLHEDIDWLNSQLETR